MLYIYIFIYTHRGRGRETEREREIDPPKRSSPLEIMYSIITKDQKSPSQNCYGTNHYTFNRKQE
jgi:hypothetical protein